MSNAYHAPFLVVGTGMTGCSVIDFLLQKGFEVAAFDTRDNPPNLNDFTHRYPNVPLFLKDIAPKALSSFQTIVLSPGISPEISLIEQAHIQKIPVIGDIELFAQYVQAPVIAITGSNGKSTVTSLVGELLKGCGKTVAVGGNIGIPALSMLDEKVDFHVLELSSFQLETVSSLKPQIATILNISPDHLDRHKTMDNYIAAKQRIYQGASMAVYLDTDNHTIPILDVPSLPFGFTQYEQGGFGLITEGAKSYIALGQQKLCACDELPLMGIHNILNALAALTIGHRLGCPVDKMIDTLKHFQGLSHRCQKIAEFDQKIWINDSKGTNPHSTMAAIEGIGQTIQGKIILIAGGQAKDDDFAALAPLVRQYVKNVLLIGQDGHLLEAHLAACAPCEQMGTLDRAVSRAATLCQPGDAVLLSPACTSWDQYPNFIARGDDFIQQVQSLKG